MQFILPVSANDDTLTKVVKRMRDIFPDAKPGNGRSVFYLPGGELIICTCEAIHHHSSNGTSPLQEHGAEAHCAARLK